MLNIDNLKLKSGFEIKSVDSVGYYTPITLENIAKNDTFSFETDLSDESYNEVFSTLFMPEEQNNIFTTTIPIITGYKQARTHKKRRINKKWRKRYGFKPIIINKFYKQKHYILA